MNIQQEIFNKIKQLEAVDSQGAAKFFGTTRTEIGKWKRQKKAPLEAVETYLATFTVEEDAPVETELAGEPGEDIEFVDPRSNPGVITEPETAPPASGRRPTTAPPMTVPEQVRPNSRSVPHRVGSPQVVAPHIPPSGVRRVPEMQVAQPQAGVPMDMSSMFAMFMRFMQQMQAGTMPAGMEMVQLPSGNIHDHVGPMPGNNTWNVPHDQVQEQRAKGRQQVQEQPQRRLVRKVADAQ